MNNIEIVTYAGHIDKAQLRYKIFSGSKYFYLRTVDSLCKSDDDFKEMYLYYKMKNNLPKFVVVKLLDYLEIGYFFTSK